MGISMNINKMLLLCTFFSIFTLNGMDALLSTLSNENPAASAYHSNPSLDNYIRFMNESFDKDMQKVAKRYLHTTDSEDQQGCLYQIKTINEKRDNFNALSLEKKQYIFEYQKKLETAIFNHLVDQRELLKGKNI